MKPTTEVKEIVKLELKKEMLNMSLMKWFQVGAPMNIYYLYKKEHFCQGNLRNVHQLKIANREYDFQ